MKNNVRHLIRRHPFQAVLGFALFLRLMTLGAYPLMDTTEARYGEMGRKMLETGNWLTPQFDYGVPFWGKPPLSIWLTAVSFKIFGINEFAARLPSFMIGLIIISLIFKIGNPRGGKYDGWTASAIFATSLLPFVMIGAVLMDPALTLGTTLVMVGFWQAINKEGRLWAYLCFIGLAIGLLAKGPVALVLSGVPIGLWAIVQKQWPNIWQRLPVVKGSILMLLLTLPWYLMAERATPGFLDYFLIGEHWNRFIEPGWPGDLYGTAHKEPYGKIWFFALAATFPWFLMLPLSLKKSGWRRSWAFAKQHSDWISYLILWLITPLLFFTFSGNVLMTYVLPGMPAFSLLGAEIFNIAPRKTDARTPPPLLQKGNQVPESKLPYAGFVMPFLLALALCISLAFKPWKSEDLLIAHYHRITSSQGNRLYYVPERPFSAEFYSQGKASKLGNLEEIAAILKDGKQDFFAVRSYWADEIKNQFGERMEEVGRSKRFILFRAREL